MFGHRDAGTHPGSIKWYKVGPVCPPGPTWLKGRQHRVTEAERQAQWTRKSHSFPTGLGRHQSWTRACEIDRKLTRLKTSYADDIGSPNATTAPIVIFAPLPFTLRMRRPLYTASELSSKKGKPCPLAT